MQGIRSIVDLKPSPGAQRQIAGAEGERFVWLPIHDRIQEEMLECASHGGCAVLIGDRRVGKTQSLLTISDQIIESGAFADASLTPVLLMAAPSSRGPTAILRQMATTGGTAAPAEGSVSELFNQAAIVMGTNGIRLVCVDEAHRLTPETIELLTALPGAARSAGYRLGVVLVGRRQLLDNLRRWRQQKR